MREKHQDWEALLERALAEECSAPASLLELVRNENGAAVFNRFSSYRGRGPWLFVPALIQFYYIHLYICCVYTNIYVRVCVCVCVCVWVCVCVCVVGSNEIWFSLVNSSEVILHFKKQLQFD